MRFNTRGVAELRARIETAPLAPFFDAATAATAAAEKKRSDEEARRRGQKKRPEEEVRRRGQKKRPEEEAGLSLGGFFFSSRAVSNGASEARAIEREGMEGRSTDEHGGGGGR